MQPDELFMLKTMTFGRLLRHFRVNRLWSIGELARAASLAKSHISQLEWGKRRPGFRALRQLARVLDLDQEAFAIFCDAAVGDGRPHMKDLPDTSSSLNTLLGGKISDPEIQGFNGIRQPRTTPEEEHFLQHARASVQQAPQTFAQVHSSSREFAGATKRATGGSEAL